MTSRTRLLGLAGSAPIVAVHLRGRVRGPMAPAQAGTRAEVRARAALDDGRWWRRPSPRRASMRTARVQVGPARRRRRRPLPTSPSSRVPNRRRWKGIPDRLRDQQAEGNGRFMFQGGCGFRLHSRAGRVTGGRRSGWSTAGFVVVATEIQSGVIKGTGSTAASWRTNSSGGISSFKPMRRRPKSRASNC